MSSILEKLDKESVEIANERVERFLKTFPYLKRETHGAMLQAMLETVYVSGANSGMKKTMEKLGI